MKKILTKMAAFIFALMMMVSSFGVNVNAAAYDTTGLDPDATTGELTLTEGAAGAKANSVYTAYKVLSLDKTTGQDVYTNYAVTTEFENAGVTFDQIKAASSGSENYTYDATKVDSIATTLANYAIANGISGNVLNVDKSKKLDIGYYLIVETTGTSGYQKIRPMLVAIPKATTDDAGNITYDYNVKVTLKDQPITTTKKILDSENAIKESISKQVGKEYTYVIEQTVPKYDATYDNNTIEFYLTDTLDDGIDYIENSVTVYTIKGSGDEAVETELGSDKYQVSFTERVDKTETTEAKKATLKFDFSNLDKKGYYDNVKEYDSIKLTYKGKLNENAQFGPSGNVNEVIPTFTHKQGETTEGKSDKTKTYAGLLELTKKDTDGKTLLEGAEFTVYTDEDCTTETQLVTYKVTKNGDVETITREMSAKSTTGDDGVVKFEGLGAGTYYIKETKSPTGYVQLTKPIKVTVSVTLPTDIVTGEELATFEYTVEGNGVDDTTVTTDATTGKVTFTVTNSKGFTLPTTGGMGTYIFTVGGAAILLVAGAMLVRSKKTSE